jgi:hypothetical protein
VLELLIGLNVLVNSTGVGVGVVAGVGETVPDGLTKCETSGVGDIGFFSTVELGVGISTLRRGNGFGRPASSAIIIAWNLSIWKK